jgi:3-deoxy-D-manno-octulosonic-acid transferase
MLILYHLLSILGFIIFSPVIYLFKNKRLCKERLGLNIPDYGQSAGGRLWVHALSVGEVLSAIPLLGALKNKYPTKEIVLSVKTSTGLDIARQKISDRVDYILPMPLDFWWSSRRMIRNINPILFIIIETDIWPGLISLLRKRGVKTILVNGRLSPQSEKSYRRWRFLIKYILQMLELALMQTEVDKYRIMKGGICENKVKVTGNIKFDRPLKPLDGSKRNKWLRLLNLKNRIIWVAGSTHYPEEKIVFHIYNQIIRSFPNLSLIIAPREAHRFDEVYNLAKNCGLKVIRKTQLMGDSTVAPAPTSSHGVGRSGRPEKTEGRKYKVFILDTLGELGGVYGLADVAFVGGSLAPLGGHNLLEPAFFGIPVLFGPHTYNFTAMSELMIKYGGGKMVADELELMDAMVELLSQKTKRDEIGKQAKECVEQNQGAIDRVVGILKSYIEIL